MRVHPQNEICQLQQHGVREMQRKLNTFNIPLKEKIAESRMGLIESKVFWEKNNPSIQKNNIDEKIKLIQTKIQQHLRTIINSVRLRRLNYIPKLANAIVLIKPDGTTVNTLEEINNGKYSAVTFAGTTSKKFMVTLD